MPSPLSPVRALLLDFGGTLAAERRPRPAIYAAAGRAHGCDVDEERMAAAMAAAHADLTPVVAGAFRYSDPWFRVFIERVFRHELGFGGELEGIAEELFATFSDAATFALFPDARRLLERLAASSPRPRVAVVSNWGERLAPVLEGLGVPADAALASALELVEKPDPELFHRALRRLGARPEEALHVGDRLEKDVAGARAAGVEALLLDRSGRMSAPPEVRVVRGLDEVPLP